MVRVFSIAVLASVSLCGPGFCLEPDEVLVAANRDVAESVEVARYYCQRRGVPVENIVELAIGAQRSEQISREDYEQLIAGPIRARLLGDDFAGKIRCVVTTYGMPYKVGGRGSLEGKEAKLKELEGLAEIQRGYLKKIEQLTAGQEEKEREKKAGRTKLRLRWLQSRIDRIEGTETSASVDSELSMVLFGDYELYRWQENRLRKDATRPGASTELSRMSSSKSNGADTWMVMVCRLDGPSAGVAKGLVDKAIGAGEQGLRGTAYIDSRGKAGDGKRHSPGHFDQSLRELATLVRLRTDLEVKEERTEKLFEPGSCPEAALYCGWYSLRKYVDAFDFVDGAIGYHIASLEAVNLRDVNSGQWCASMLADGIAATLGPVAEPYLHSIPEPKEFFLELFDGWCLAEAYYRSKPFNSWQLVLIGDPLYRPFKGTFDKEKQGNSQ